jgi:uncharacterized protein (DUF1778 family)
MTAAIKKHRINIRCDKHTRDLLDRAAAYAHVGISEFVLSHALAAAEQLVLAHESITLKPADFQAFLSALDAPGKPNAALQKAFERHAEKLHK